MKILFFVSLFFSTTLALAKPSAICSLYYSGQVIPKAEAHSKNDKNRHCTVSCMLTLRCPSGDVLLAGALKELKDLFGPGNAEAEDLVADVIGIDLVLTRAAKSDKQCLQQCDLYYAR